MILDSFTLTCIVKIFCSLLVGILLGMERKYHLQGIGIRTILLISVSSTLLGILSEYGAMSTTGVGGDPTRIAAAVVTGIGFLGGGAIIHQGLNIKGLTTATIVWSSAAIGLAIGDGLYVPSLITLIVILISLPVFEKVETKFFPAEKNKIVRFEFKNATPDLDFIKDSLKKNGMVLGDFSVENSFKNDKIDISISVKSPSEVDLIKLAKEFEKMEGLTKFSFGE